MRIVQPHRFTENVLGKKSQLSFFVNYISILAYKFLKPIEFIYSINVVCLSTSCKTFKKERKT